MGISEYIDEMAWFIICHASKNGHNKLTGFDVLQMLQTSEQKAKTYSKIEIFLCVFFIPIQRILNEQNPNGKRNSL